MAPGKKRGDKNDVTWDHCMPLENDKKHLQCNYCKKKVWGGVFRMKHHIARTKKNVSPCSKASEETTEMFRKLLELKKTDKEDRDGRRCDIGSSDSYYPNRDPSTDQGEKGKRKASMDSDVLVSEKKQCTLNESSENGNRDTVCGAISRFFHANCIPLNVVKSSSFASMMESVSHFGKGLKLPSYDELQNRYLDKEVDGIEALMNIRQKEWGKRGCTIMFRGAKRSVMDFLVTGFNGKCFLNREYISTFSHSAEELFEVFDSVVEEVGEEHVVQFMTDSTSANVKAAELLMQKRIKLFWSPCAAHLLDLILDDIGILDVHSETIAKACIVSLYLCKQELLDIKLPTRLSASYHDLERLTSHNFFITTIDFNTKEEDRKVQDIVQSSSFWSSIDYIIKCASPLVKVRHLLYSDGEGEAPYVYAMMESAKKAIAKNVDNVAKLYWPIWNIVDKWWSFYLRCPLSAAKCYLNPAFYYEESFNTDSEVKEGLNDLLKRCEVKEGLNNLLKRLCPTLEERVVIDQQLDTFKSAMRSFGREKAKDTRKTKHPDLWWESNGGLCPELQMLAIRVLSQTCIIDSRCEHNWITSDWSIFDWNRSTFDWSTFEKIPPNRGLEFDQSSQHKLVYVINNMNLLEQQKMREANRDLDPICLSDSESDDERITLPEEQQKMREANKDLDPVCLSDSESDDERITLPEEQQKMRDDEWIASPWFCYFKSC